MDTNAEMLLNPVIITFVLFIVVFVYVQTCVPIFSFIFLMFTSYLWQIKINGSVWLYGNIWLLNFESDRDLYMCYKLNCFFLKQKHLSFKSNYVDNLSVITLSMTKFKDLSLCFGVFKILCMYTLTNIGIRILSSYKISKRLASRSLL